MMSSIKVKTHRKKTKSLGVILLTENLRAQNVGRELVFSADL